MHKAKNQSYWYWKFHTTNLSAPLLFCYYISCVLYFKMYNPKIILVTEFFRTTNPQLRLPTHSYFLEFCISTYIIQNSGYYYWFFTQQALGRSHPLDTLYSVMCFNVYISKNSNFYHWNFFRRNPSLPPPSRYSLSCVQYLNVHNTKNPSCCC